MIIPTSFAPVNKEATAAAQLTAKKGGAADLHSMAAWENVFIIKEAMEMAKISGKKDPASVQADRRKIRDALASIKTTKGLLGVSKRTEDREADKPYLFVHAKGGNWQVLHNPL
jgi:branched-chain amino acid transport system substrate-binding protein